jgi:hypothetical protein
MAVAVQFQITSLIASQLQSLIMKLFAFAISLLLRVASIFATPIVAEIEKKLTPGGYDHTIEMIVATVYYVVTETGSCMKSNKCNQDKWGINATQWYIPHYPFKNQIFYNELVIDIEVVVVVIEEDIVYLKCKQPAEYVDDNASNMAMVGHTIQRVS